MLISIDANKQTEIKTQQNYKHKNAITKDCNRKQ